jgi:hypothetical protein
VDSVTHPLLVGARIGMCVWLAWHLFGMILVALYSPKALFSQWWSAYSFFYFGWFRCRCEVIFYFLLLCIADFIFMFLVCFVCISGVLCILIRFDFFYVLIIFVI